MTKFEKMAEIIHIDGSSKQKNLVERVSE